MTLEEFENWIADYQSRNHWVGEMLTASDSLVDDWCSAFIPFTLDEMKAATRYLMALDPQPSSENHFPKLIAFLKSQRFKPRDKNVYPTGRPVSYRCLGCRDTGSIYVYHPMAYDPIREGVFSVSRHLREIVVACTCTEANKHTRERSDKRYNQPMLKFCNNTMRPVEASTTEDQVQELTEFVLSDYKPRNFHRELSDW